MRNKVWSIILLLLTVPVSKAFGGTEKVDVLVAGGGASGVAAAIQAARMGMHVALVEETDWLGGMLTSAGVSAVDGNYKLPGGIWGEFKERLEKHYGSREALITGWVSDVLFEPSVGNRIFHEMAAAEPTLTIWHRTRIESIRRLKGQWLVKVRKDAGKPQEIQAQTLIDATELGDVAKQCGVRYDIGMESREVTHEAIAPEKANNIVQDITYVAILKDYGRDVSIPRPVGYQPEEFACACESPLCITPKEPHRVWSAEKMLTYGKLPNKKYMLNWPIEGNDYYVNIVEMTPKERIKALEAAKQRTLRFIYFMQNELGWKHLGLADDEYPTPDRLPFIPYHRESRRIHGVIRFTVNDAASPYTQADKLYRTCIAVGDYPVDHHHSRYNGTEILPDLYFHPIPSYGLPVGVMLPKDVKGLIVAEKSISVSNIVNGTTRLQPVVLQIGQAAGALAALGIKQGKRPDEVAVRDIQNVLLEAKGYLLPYLDVPVSDVKFKSYQRIGSTGILKGKGKHVDWSNETWLRADTLLLGEELEGLMDIYPKWAAAHGKLQSGNITLDKALSLIGDIAKQENLTLKATPEAVWQAFGLQDFRRERPILRGEMAVLIDQMLDPFNRVPVDIKGAYLR